jgi:hypothetical protein
MKYLILLSFFFNSAFACDWSTIQSKGSEYIYSLECHKSVGKLVILNDKNELEIKELRKTIEFKDLAIQKADERVLLWKDEAYKQYDFLQKNEQKSAWTNAMWFGAGFLSVMLGAWAAGQVN